MRDFLTAHIDKNFYVDFPPRQWWINCYRTQSSIMMGMRFPMIKDADSELRGLRLIGMRPAYRIHVKLKKGV